MKLPNIQQRYIRRYALAVVIHERLVNYFNDKFRRGGESDLEHLCNNWISGGFKAHWPESVKDRLRRLNRRANKYRLQASLMRPRYQRTKKLYKLCKEAIEQARIDIAMHNTYHLAA